MKKTAGMVIRISDAQLQQAREHAQFVGEKSRKDGRKLGQNMDAQFSPEEIQEKRTMGVAAEIAAAMFLGVAWEPKVDVFTNEADIPGWDVRCTSRPDGALIIRPNDRLERNIIFLHQKSGRDYVVLGWINGEAGMKVARYTDFGHSNRPKVPVVDQKFLNKVFPEEG